ncbi:MAG TPA: YetF domain-containing protein [Puia sp.]|jgi:uncharacterized membrane protein YcaP (DUF421 family)
MDILIQVFGEDKNLTVLQMVFRGVVVFLIALVLIRISGRRSFGIRTSLDNIISMLLGAVLSRAVVGASPFLPVLCSCLGIVLLHRAFGWMLIRSDRFARLVEGSRIQLFKNGRFNEENMRKGLVCKEDIMQGVRKSALTENLDEIEAVFMERNGEITAIKKQTGQ